VLCGEDTMDQQARARMVGHSAAIVASAVPTGTGNVITLTRQFLPGYSQSRLAALNFLVLQNK